MRISFIAKRIKKGLKLEQETYEEMYDLFIQASITTLKRYSQIYNNRFKEFFKGSPFALAFISIDNFFEIDKELAISAMEATLGIYDKILSDKLIVEELICSLMYVLISSVCSKHQIGKITRVNKKGFEVEIYFKE